MREIKIFAARHTYSPHAPHLQFVGDTIGALGWVVAGDRPIHFIRESYDGGKHHVKHIPGEMSVTNFCQMSLPTYLTLLKLSSHCMLSVFEQSLLSLSSLVKCKSDAFCQFSIQF